MKKTVLSSIAIILITATLLSIFSISAFAASNKSEYYPKYTGRSNSIVDALNSIGVNSSYANRKIIAQINGINNYSGSAKQNEQLLSLVKSGRLKNPSYTPHFNNSSNGNNTSNNTSSTNYTDSSKYYPKYTGKGGISTALKSLGINNSYAYRVKIAKANAATTGSLANYKGTASQNDTMLSLLKKGQLIRAEYVAKNDSNLHSHSMKKVSDTDDITIKYCSCGYFECHKTGVVGTSANALTIPLPNNGNLIDLGSLGQAIDSLGSVVAAGGTAAASLLTNPYVIAAVVCGVVIFIVISRQGKALKITKVERVSAVKHLEELDESKFYCAGLLDHNGFKSVLIIKAYEMDMEDAILYSKMIAQFHNPLQVKVDNLDVSLGSIYTYHWYEAEEMCRRLAKDIRYKYGSDKAADCNIGFNKKYRGENVMYYEHYHVYYWSMINKKHNKVNEFHVFFGTPYAIPKPPVV